MPGPTARSKRPQSSMIPISDCSTVVQQLQHIFVVFERGVLKGCHREETKAKEETEIRHQRVRTRISIDDKERIWLVDDIWKRNTVQI
jgi:hypothetical protein